MLVDFGKASYIEKARQQPEKVRQVLDKIRTDGLLPTIDAVQSKLDQPIPLGYCNVGVVLGEEVKKLRRAEDEKIEGEGGKVRTQPLNLSTSQPLIFPTSQLLSLDPEIEW